MVVSPTPFDETAMARGMIPLDDPDFCDEKKEVFDLPVALPNHASLNANPDLSGSCGTMQLSEYAQGQKKLMQDLDKLTKTDEPLPEEDLLTDEVEELRKAFK